MSVFPCDPRKRTLDLTKLWALRDSRGTLLHPGSGDSTRFFLEVFYPSWIPPTRRKSRKKKKEGGRKKKNKKTKIPPHPIPLCLCRLVN